MPSDRFSHTVDVAAPSAAVWQALQSAETWKGIGPIDRVWDAVNDPDGNLAGYRWSATAAGRQWEGTARRTALDPGRSLRLDLDSSEIVGAIEVSVAPGGSSRLTVTLEASPKGVLATVFWGVAREALRRGLDDHVEEFARRFSPT
ncbi:MAG: SRPBCC family protein [Actinomycetota bacterium]